MTQVRRSAGTNHDFMYSKHAINQEL
jgi:hypothetical protein